MKTFLHLLPFTLFLSINIQAQRFQWAENTGSPYNDYGEPNLWFAKFSEDGQTLNLIISK